MPTPVTTADKMTVRGKNGGKHWTRAEVEAREAAAAQGKRERRVTLKPPAWLGEDALRVWREIRRKLEGIELLDNLDTELLAIYCDAIVHYRESAQVMACPPEGMDINDAIKTTQAWARIVSTYADKLGLTPGGRARLAKRKAEKTVDAFEEAFG